jgi:signal transduction histidine kinase
VSIRIVRSENGVELTVSDDGIGFDVDTAIDEATHGRSLGLLSMQERVVLAGGRIDIESNKNEGAEIRVQFSLNMDDLLSHTASEPTL